LREGQRLFRYDNAPHHPKIKTHPHHKHIGPGDKISPSGEPSLAQVLEEIESLMK
jgi:hypothetical protein